MSRSPSASRRDLRAGALQLLADEHVAAVQVGLLLLKGEDPRLQPAHFPAQMINLVVLVLSDLMPRGR